MLSATLYKIKDIPYGGLFLWHEQVHIRGKPVGFFLNSDLVCSAINKNYIFATSLETGKLRIISAPEKEVEVCVFDTVTYKEI